MFRFLLIIFIVLLTNLIHAQTNFSKAYQLMYKGAQAELDKDFAKASSYYQKAILTSGADLGLYSTCAIFFEEQKEYALASKTLERALLLPQSKKDNSGLYLKLAQIYVLDGVYSKANYALSQVDKTALEIVATQQIYNKLQKDIQFGFTTNTNDSIIVQLLSAAINSSYDDYFPSINASNNELIFTSKTSGVDEDFYVAVKDSCEAWMNAKDMGIPLNSKQQEGAHFMSADRNYLFYMRCGNPTQGERTMGGCDLYLAYRTKTGWSEGEPFGATINTPYYEGMPCLSGDSKSLYFVSDKLGGYGGKDIWVTHFIDGLWQIPENLGPEINTPFDEESPFLAIDNTTLYFSSNGHPGFGGKDIYKATRNIDGKWTSIHNMGRGINSNANDISFVVAVNGGDAYFASDRIGGFGGFDIYSVLLPESLQPQPMTMLYGKITDSISNRPLKNTKVDFYYQKNNQLIGNHLSNKGDGSYVANLPLYDSIEIVVNRVGFEEFRSVIYFDSSRTDDFDTLHIALLPEYYEMPIYSYKLTQLNFERNQLEINEVLKEMLVEKISPLVHSNYIFKINGYTDNTGTSYINQEYSLKRAKLVEAFIINLGVDPSRISAQGWGDADPIVENIDEESRYRNRRVEITIIGTETYLDAESSEMLGN